VSWCALARRGAVCAHGRPLSAVCRDCRADAWARAAAVQRAVLEAREAGSSARRLALRRALGEMLRRRLSELRRAGDPVPRVLTYAQVVESLTAAETRGLSPDAAESLWALADRGADDESRLALEPADARYRAVLVALEELGHPSGAEGPMSEAWRALRDGAVQGWLDIEAHRGLGEVLARAMEADLGGRHALAREGYRCVADATERAKTEWLRWRA